METERIFRERLMQLRLKKGVSRKQVAENIGITETGYRNYEKGHRKPAFNVLPTIADFFDVSTDYLLGRTDNPKMN